VCVCHLARAGVRLFVDALGAGGGVSVFVVLVLILVCSPFDSLVHPFVRSCWRLSVCCWWDRCRCHSLSWLQLDRVVILLLLPCTLQHCGWVRVMLFSRRCDWCSCHRQYNCKIELLFNFRVYGTHLINYTAHYCG
jgi:hypothetical protein